MKSTKVIPNKQKKRGRGRPATGKDPLIALRLPREVIGAVDAWATRHKAGSRSAAVRTMIEMALRAK